LYLSYREISIENGTTFPTGLSKLSRAAGFSATSDIDWHTLDLKRMVLYHGDIKGHSSWILVIPTFGNELYPGDHFEISLLSPHKKFSEKDFPSDFPANNNMAVITGFPE